MNCSLWTGCQYFSRLPVVHLILFHISLWDLLETGKKKPILVFIIRHPLFSLHLNTPQTQKMLLLFFFHYRRTEKHRETQHRQAETQKKRNLEGMGKGRMKRKKKWGQNAEKQKIWGNYKKLRKCLLL